MSKKIKNEITETASINLCIKRFKNPDTVEKIRKMQLIGINITDFVEWAILNFDVEAYLKVMRCKQ